MVCIELKAGNRRQVVQRPVSTTLVGLLTSVLVEQYKDSEFKFVILSVEIKKKHVWSIQYGRCHIIVGTVVVIVRWLSCSHLTAADLTYRCHLISATQHKHLGVLGICTKILRPVKCLRVA